MNLPLHKGLCAVAAALVAGLGASAAQAAETWNFSNAVGTAVTTTACCTSSSVGLTVGAWGATGTGGFAAAYLTNQTTNGIGLQTTGESTNSPDHAVDSKGGAELVALTFAKAVKLESVTLGWTSSDADFGLLAWTGAGAPAASTISGKTGSTLGAGWTLVGLYGDDERAGGSATADNETNTTTAVNPARISSSYWLVGAFNSAYGAPGGSFDGIFDAWKLLAVSGSPTVTNGVPEPSSLALVGVALLGGLYRRRRGKTVG